MSDNVDVRVIAAANADSRQAVDMGEFRNDIPLLIEHFLRKYTRTLDIAHMFASGENFEHAVLSIGKDGNLSEAARQLGMPRPQLAYRYNKLS